MCLPGRDGDDLVVTLRINGIKGDYAAPEDAWWNEKSLGQAKWEKPDNTSGYYEVQLYRGKSKVYSVSQTSAVQYNFYPYMTKTGEYTFKVRTVPGTDSQKKYGGKSEWIESGELSITDRYVSDGKGQQIKKSFGKVRNHRYSRLGKKRQYMELQISGWLYMPWCMAVGQRILVLF